MPEISEFRFDILKFGFEISKLRFEISKFRFMGRRVKGLLDKLLGAWE